MSRPCPNGFREHLCAGRSSSSYQRFDTVRLCRPGHATNARTAAEFHPHVLTLSKHERESDADTFKRWLGALDTRLPLARQRAVIAEDGGRFGIHTDRRTYRSVSVQYYKTASTQYCKTASERAGALADAEPVRERESVAGGELQLDFVRARRARVPCRRVRAVAVIDGLGLLGFIAARRAGGGPPQPEALAADLDRVAELVARRQHDRRGDARALVAPRA